MTLKKLDQKHSELKNTSPYRPAQFELQMTVSKIKPYFLLRLILCQKGRESTSNWRGPGLPALTFARWRHLSTSTQHQFQPEPDWDYLLEDPSIGNNIVNRKGVGDIQLLRRLASTSEDPKRDPNVVAEALKIPNATHPNVPVGSEEYSKEVAVFNQGLKRQHEDGAKTHLEIGNRIKGLRTENVGRTTGKKSYYLMNDMALLERALIKYTVKCLRSAGFSFVSVPDILSPSVIRGCGFETHSTHNDAVFKVRIPVLQESASNLKESEEYCLSGTAEMGIAALLRQRKISRSDLPLRIASVSRCFRSEIATRVVDKGLYRVLQFTKVEMFVLSPADIATSEAILEDLLRLQTTIFEPLGFPFRVLEMATEELGAPAYHKYDIEAWIESRHAFSEISSTSNCTDFQSRRLGFRYDDQGISKFCHSLNGTACALPRMIQTIVEQNQSPEGDVVVPDVLVPFCRGKKVLQMPPDWPVYYYHDVKENEEEKSSKKQKTSNKN